MQITDFGLGPKFSKALIEAIPDDVVSNLEVARKAIEIVVRACAVRHIVDVFKKRPWLDAFGLELTEEREMDDGGQTYPTFSIDVREVEWSNNKAFKSHFLSGADIVAIDHERVEQDVKEALEGNKDALCEGLRLYGETVFSVHFHRSLLALINEMDGKVEIASAIEQILEIAYETASTGGCESCAPVAQKQLSEVTE